MKTKIVYVLVSDETDLYYEQVLLSLYSLHLHNPQIKVEIVVDPITKSTLTEKRIEIFKYINNIIEISTPSTYNKVQRSRYLKTSLRDIIKGDFLYIDTDTIICSSLSEIDSFNSDLCAVLDNHHGEIIDWQVDKSPEALEWKYLKGSKHFCGGVIYAKDTTVAHVFFNIWHNNWKHSASFGCNYDQLGLRKAVLESNYTIEEIDGTWNCQIARDSSVPYQSNAKIMHYQGASFDIQYKICSEETLLKIKFSGNIPNEIKSLISKSQKAFNNRIINVSTNEYNYLKSPLFSTYCDYPLFFNFLIKISLLYQGCIKTLYNIKKNIF